MSDDYEVQPYQEFPVPETGLTVTHQGSEEDWVHVEDNGSLRFGYGDSWRVWVTQPDAMVDRSEVVALLRALTARVGLDGFEPSELDAAIDEAARRVADGADIGLEAARVRAETKPQVQDWLRRNGGANP